MVCPLSNLSFPNSVLFPASINFGVDSASFCSRFRYSLCSFASSFERGACLLYRAYPDDTFPSSPSFNCVHEPHGCTELRVSSLRAAYQGKLQLLIASDCMHPNRTSSLQRTHGGRFHTRYSITLVSCIFPLIVAGPVPGIDTKLPEPEKVANAFGDKRLEDK